MTSRERAERVARTVYYGNHLAFIAQDLVPPGMTSEDALSDRIAAAIDEARAEAFEEAARVAEGFPATDAFDALDPCCYCDGVADAIRALLAPKGKKRGKGEK